MRFLRLPTDHQEKKPDTSALEAFRNKPRRTPKKTPTGSENPPTKRRGRRITWTRPNMDGGEE